MYWKYLFQVFERKKKNDSGVFKKLSFLPAAHSTDSKKILNTNYCILLCSVENNEIVKFRKKCFHAYFFIFRANTHSKVLLCLITLLRRKVLIILLFKWYRKHFEKKKSLQMNKRTISLEWEPISYHFKQNLFITIFSFYCSSKWFPLKLMEICIARRTRMNLHL